MTINSLFIQHVCDPEHALALFRLSCVEVEVGTLFVKAYAVGEAHGGRNEKVGGLRVGCPEQE
jgi:hypothetical protein